MAKADGAEAYRERRSVARASLHSSIRFSPDPTRPLQLARGITQDLSISGAQILSQNLLDERRSFDVWIMIPGHEVVKALAHVVWMHVEDVLADSPYWIRAGFSLAFSNKDDRKAVSDFVGGKTDIERVTQQEIQTKIGYVF